MFFPCDRVLLHHLLLLQIPDGFRSSDTGCQSTLQCVQRKFPVAVSATQQFKILGIRAAKPPILVHHISDAGLCLFHAVPVQVPDRKLELLLVIVSWASLVPVQQELIVFREFPDHRWYAFIGIVILGNEGEGLENETIALCDYTVKIPMTHGVDSLNVAAASAVAFWQLGKIIL